MNSLERTFHPFLWEGVWPLGELTQWNQFLGLCQLLSISVYTTCSGTGKITTERVHILLGLLLDSTQNSMCHTLQQKLRTSIWKLSEYMATLLSQGQCQSGKRALDPLGKAQGEKSQCVSIVLLQASISLEGLCIWELIRSGSEERVWIPAMVTWITLHSMHLWKEGSSGDTYVPIVVPPLLLNSKYQFSGMCILFLLS